MTYNVFGGTLNLAVSLSIYLDVCLRQSRRKPAPNALGAQRYGAPYGTKTLAL